MGRGSPRTHAQGRIWGGALAQDTGISREKKYANDYQFSKKTRLSPSLE